MNSGRKFSLVAAIFVVPVMLMASDSIDYGKVNPPWRPGKVYVVKSKYEMRLDNIILDVRKVRKAYAKRHWYTPWKVTHHPEKVEEHYRSEPFSGAYLCYLNYETRGAYFQNKNSGFT